MPAVRKHGGHFGTVGRLLGQVHVERIAVDGVENQ